MARLKTRLGFPIGSLGPRSTDLFNKIGTPVSFDDRIYKVELEQKDWLISVFFMRPLKMPRSIKRGVIDVGIFGSDCVANEGLGDYLQEVTPLTYSKTTNHDVELALFAKRGFNIRKCKSKVIWVGTEFDKLTRLALKKFYPSYKFYVEHIDQTIETYVIAGEFDMGVTVVESGKTLKKNNLKKVKKIMNSHTGLWARKDDMANTEFRDKITYLGDKLRGALRAEKNEILKMNVSAEIKDRVIKFLLEQRSISLPESESPTVSDLIDGGHAIEIVVLENKKFDLIYSLKDLGVTKIVVINQVKSILY